MGARGEFTATGPEQLHLRCTRAHLTADTRTETREPALHPRDLQALYRLDKAAITAGNSPRCGERPLLFQAGIKVDRLKSPAGPGHPRPGTGAALPGHRGCSPGGGPRQTWLPARAPPPPRSPVLRAQDGSGSRERRCDPAARKRPAAPVRLRRGAAHGASTSARPRALLPPAPEPPGWAARGRAQGHGGAAPGPAAARSPAAPRCRHRSQRAALPPRGPGARPSPASRRPRLSGPRLPRPPLLADAAAAPPGGPAAAAGADSAAPPLPGRGRGGRVTTREAGPPRAARGRCLRPGGGTERATMNRSVQRRPGVLMNG